MTEMNECLSPSSIDRTSSRSVHTPGQGSGMVEEAQAEVGRLIETLLPEDLPLPEFERSQADPVYLILSSKFGLMRKFGRSGFERLDDDLGQLKRTIERTTGMRGLTVYVDDEATLPYEMEPVNPGNPWQIKVLVDALEARLNEQGEEIRYILIVGGNAVVPFHRLPNPLDDQDADVPSDNPYASRDANYLIPERAVGRLPDGDGEGVEFLRGLIRTAVDGHQRGGVAKGVLDAIIGNLRTAGQALKNGDGLGYSASVWRKASRAVFKTIGDNRHLRTSPPLTFEDFAITERPRFGYFNLHGTEDGPNWYGQRDSLFPAEYPLFPVALRPQELTEETCINSIVFSEACYGANVLGKTADTSIALRLLASRALAVVGSTKVSYGAIAPPLVGADVIGRSFWQGLQSRLTVGEALKVAKVQLARQMQESQGYLDGEDQKALVSFVLYGDPSLPARTGQSKATLRVASKALCPPIICQRLVKPQEGSVSDALITTVKSHIEANLPHMERASVQAAPVALCSPSGAKAASRGEGNWAFTLKKDIPVEGDGAHRQVVKVTVDEKGHILKMAVSK